MSRIGIVRHFYYPDDPRVRREAEALAAAGHEVEVICLRRDGEAAREEVGGVRVFRLPLDHRRGSFRRYLAEYGASIALSALFLLRRSVPRRYDIVQVNTIPDALVFAALGPKLLGARIVIDMHECMPELFEAEHGKGPGHPVNRLLARAEQWSMAFADQVITCTEQQKATFVRRGTPADKIAVALNCGDEALYRPQTAEPVRWDVGGPFRLITHGLVAERYGQDTLVRAVALLRDELPGLAVEVYGQGEYLPRLRALVAELGVGDRVRIAGYVPHEELLAAIGRAHVGVVAAKRDVFRDLTHTNKMFEYALMRKPVVIAETSAVRAYFDDDSFAYFRSADPADLARALRELYHHPERADAMIASAAARCRGYAWARQREIYRAAVLGGPTPAKTANVVDAVEASGALAGARTEA